MPRSYEQQATPGTVTATLRDVARGVPNAEHRLWSLVYAWLLEQATAMLRRDPLRLEVTPTDLVHGAYAKLTEGYVPTYADRQHFRRIAGRAMRQILVDLARHHVVARKAERWTHERFLDLQQGKPISLDEQLDIDAALVELARVDARKAKFVEMRYYAGMDVVDIASALQVSRGTTTRELGLAIAWLAVRLGSGARPGFDAR